MEQRTGMLSLCATPIGNLEDITLRVLRVLREADAVWAEDTRRTLALLNHFGLKKPLLSCHEHNERERAKEVVSAVSAGRRIAYCSDAGMPGISDPGRVLLEACMEAGLPYEVLPGASAVPMAAVLSGLMENGDFAFYGFLPREKKPRKARLAGIARSEIMVLLYESPLRLPATLRELAAVLGEDRPAAVLRELTKRHEETVRGTLKSLTERFCDPPRGECVIAIAGKPKETIEADPAALDALLSRLLREGYSVKDAAAEAAEALEVAKKAAYRRAMELKNAE